MGSQIKNYVFTCDDILFGVRFDLGDQKWKTSKVGVRGRFYDFNEVSWWFFRGGVAWLESQKSLIAIKSCDSKVKEVTILSDF